MRPIKFRAWIAFEKKMIFNTSLHSNDDSDVNPWIFMQFTGLKDKNGVEIYEGDIVRVSANPPIGEVVFDKGRWLIKHKPLIKDDLWTDLNYLPCIVLGNVYEHPELLGKEGGRG